MVKLSDGTTIAETDAQQERRMIAERKARKVAPALNVRRVERRVCATCYFGLYVSGSLECQRDNGPVLDAGDMLQWQTTCDRWRNSGGE